MNYARQPAFVLGFHGCDRAVANQVVQTPGHLLASENSYDWLGHGIYFWENSPARAAQWAADKTARARRAGQAFVPAVVGAIIDLGNCLDLLDAGTVDLVAEGYEYLKTSCERQGVPLPENANLPDGSGYLLRRLDCAVVNALHTMVAESGGPAFDSVRAAFIEGEPIYAGAGFRRKNHIQICVRRPENVRGYFHPFP